MRFQHNVPPIGTWMEYATSVFTSLWKLLVDYVFRLLPAAVGTLFGG